MINFTSCEELTVKHLRKACIHHLFHSLFAWLPKCFLCIAPTVHCYILFIVGKWLVNHVLSIGSYYKFILTCTNFLLTPKIGAIIFFHSGWCLALFKRSEIFGLVWAFFIATTHHVEVVASLLNFLLKLTLFGRDFGQRMRFFARDLLLKWWCRRGDHIG